MMVQKQSHVRRIVFIHLPMLAIVAFALVLIYRTVQTVGTDDLHELKATDR